MKSCGCEYCNDLRHISPAKYIGVDNLPKYDDARIFIEDAAKIKSLYGTLSMKMMTTYL